ncbi:hypothetical protein BC831DRAFT_178453 [Entophlyctis helioformis]|nr:hypothetical protein BC831DRAFT_178453 [Entophlyctis helioformis]
MCTGCRTDVSRLTAATTATASTAAAVAHLLASRRHDRSCTVSESASMTLSTCKHRSTHLVERSMSQMRAGTAGTPVGANRTTSGSLNTSRAAHGTCLTSASFALMRSSSDGEATAYGSSPSGNSRLPFPWCVTCGGVVCGSAGSMRRCWLMNRNTWLLMRVSTSSRILSYSPDFCSLAHVSRAHILNTANADVPLTQNDCLDDRLALAMRLRSTSMPPTSARWLSRSPYDLSALQRGMATMSRIRSSVSTESRGSDVNLMPSTCLCARAWTAVQQQSSHMLV